MGRKFKFSKLRELHAAIGALIEESDANMAGAAGADEDDNDVATGDDLSAQSKLAAGHAQDAAPRGGRTQSMKEAFPNWRVR
jgi:hypothetical protein